MPDQVLARVAASLNAQPDLEKVLSVVCDETARALDVPAATVALYDDQRNVFCPAPGFGLPPEHAQELQPILCALHEQVIRQPGPVVVIPDLQSHPALAGASVRALADARTLACASMIHAGQWLGLLVVVTFSQARAFDQDEQALLQGLAAQVALAVANARLREAVRREITERKRTEETLAALNKGSQAIVSTLNFEAVLKLVINEVKGLLDAEEASVMLRDPASGELVFAAVAGKSSSELVSARMPVTQGIAGWVMQNRQSVRVENAQSDPRFYPGIDQKTALTTHSLVAVPLRFRGAVWGVIEAINKVSGAFSQEDVELLEALARWAAIAIENAQLYQAEHELRRLLEQSRIQLTQSERLAATGRMAAALAHEINNPLQAIYNCLQAIREFELEPDERHEYLQTAIQEVERLTGTVSRVLDVARHPQREMRPAHLNQIVERVLALTAKYLQHRHIVIRQELGPDLPPIQAVPDELQQVFLNLILNAADAMAEGGTLRVTSRLSDDGRLAASFSDTGSGIPPEHLQRIFEPFFTTKERGTGMGLGISNHVIRQHGGEITVESQAGKGTTFTVWLPIISS